MTATTTGTTGHDTVETAVTGSGTATTAGSSTSATPVPVDLAAPVPVDLAAPVPVDLTTPVPVDLTTAADALADDWASWTPRQWADWRAEVRALAESKNAVLLAHNYQIPQIQDIADHVGDSLALSRLAATVPQEIIVFAGVHFMAETAAILSPGKRVLIPDAAAGCSLADTINADQLRAWKAEHPGAKVVSYVNTTAEVKAETDICCTSSNAVEVVESIPADTEVLFGPDMFLGAHVKRVTGRDNIHVWLGECHVHAGISPANLISSVRDNTEAELYVHPECGCTTSALWLSSTGELPAERTHVLSTGGMLDAARTSQASKVLVATEIGMLHQLRKANPRTEFVAVNPQASCPYMKMITPPKLLRSLREERDEVRVDPQIAERARAAVERMIAIGNPGSGE